MVAGTRKFWYWTSETKSEQPSNEQQPKVKEDELTVRRGNDQVLEDNADQSFDPNRRQNEGNSSKEVQVPNEDGAGSFCRRLSTKTMEVWKVSSNIYDYKWYLERNSDHITIDEELLCLQCILILIGS